MPGAILGDIAGSRFECRNSKAKLFKLITDECRITDDSIMTLAVARTLKTLIPNGPEKKSRISTNIYPVSASFPFCL